MTNSLTEKINGAKPKSFTSPVKKIVQEFIFRILVS